MCCRERRRFSRASFSIDALLPLKRLTMRGVALAVVVALQATVLVVASIKDPNKISARRVASKRGLSSFSGEITSLMLIDTETDTKVADLVNGTIIAINSAKFAATSAWSINASFLGEDIGSVRFGHNGNPNVHTENKAWYSFCGNSGTDFFNCSALSVIGNHTVTATPFSNRSAAGESGTPYTVTFAVVSSDHDNMPLSVKAKTPNVPSITPIAAPAPTGAAVKPLIPTGAVVPAPVASPSMPTDSPANRNSTASMVTTPQLLNMTVSSSAINVTSGPATVNVWIKVQDVGSQFNEFSIEAAAPGIVYQTSGRCSTSDRGMAGSTVFIGCMLRLIFAQHCPAGNYSLQLYANDENYGYHVNAAELQRRGFSHVIHVASASPDMTPPTLLDMAILSDATSVNVTDGDVEWDVQIVVQDEWGVEHGFVEAIGPDGSEAVPGYFGTYDYNTSIAAVPLTFNVSLFFVNNNAPGNYYLQVRLSTSLATKCCTTPLRCKQTTYRRLLKFSMPPMTAHLPCCWTWFCSLQRL
jgi:hypothetical protein